MAVELSLVALGIFVFSYLQSVAQTLASERVARDLRTRLVAKISTQDHAYIQQITPATLLTNLTSDVDAVKMFVSQAIASLISSVFLIIGASALLLSINWKLGLAVLSVLPIIGVTFSVVLRRVRKLFIKAQEAIDWLNKVINESILGSALIRLLNSQQHEYEKFLAANDRGARHQPQHPAALRQPDPGDHVRHQPRDAHDSDDGRPVRDPGVDDPRRVHGVQQLSVDSHFPGHHDRLHEQRDGAGRRVVHAPVAGARSAGRKRRPASSWPICAATSACGTWS